MRRKELIRGLQFNRRHWPSRISYVGREDRKALNYLDEAILNFQSKGEWITERITPNASITFFRKKKPLVKKEKAE